MDILIHDVNDQESKRVFHDISKNAHIISDTGSIKNCVGCFGCWIKTPGKCVIKDGYEDLGEMLPFCKDIPLGHGPNKNIGRVLKGSTYNITALDGGKGLSISPNWSRSLWKIQTFFLFFKIFIDFYYQ